MEKEALEQLLVKIKEEVNTQLTSFKDDSGFEGLKTNLNAVQKSLTTLEETIENVQDENTIKSVEDKMKTLESLVKEQGLSLEKYKANGINTPEKSNMSFKEVAKNFVESDAFKNFADKNGNGRSEKHEIKATSLSGSYQDFANAPATLTNESGVVVMQPFQMRPNRIRDLMSSSPISVPFVISEEVVDWVNNISVNTENGTLVEYDFKVEPKTFQKRRLGAYVKISKDMLQSADFIVSEVERALPSKYYYVEDNEILRGSGTGNHLEGLFSNANRRVFDVEFTFLAGTIATVEAAANGGVLLTFVADHKLYDNYDLTIDASTNYDATYKVFVQTKKKLVIDATYVAETSTSWTATASHPLKDKVTAPNTGDVVSAAAKTLHNGYNRPTGIVMNPYDVYDANHAKGTDAHYVGRYERINGTLYIDGIPVIENDAVPAGKVYLGDFMNSARLYDYKTLEVYMDSDVSYNLNNQVALIIEAHLINANFNPLMFMEVDIADAKTKLAV